MSPLLDRPFMVLVRRELWEHRSLIWAPLGMAAAIIMLSALSGAIHGGFQIDLREGVAALKSGPAIDRGWIGREPLTDRGGGCRQPDDRPASFGEEPSIRLADDDAAAGGQHAVEILQKTRQHVRLGIPKCSFTAVAHERGDRAPEPLLEHRISVDPGGRAAVGEQPRDRRLAGAAIPDECGNRHADPYAGCLAEAVARLSASRITC
jgi:hypothetical protein